MDKIQLGPGNGQFEQAAYRGYNTFGVEFLRGLTQGSSFLATLSYRIVVPLGRG
jgi:hypothetical protein